MKALLLAATSSLALTGFAMAQTATPDSATTTESTAVVEDIASDMEDAAAGAADQVEDAADSAESAMDEAVTTDAADAAEDAADSAESAADEAVTADFDDAAVTTTTDTTVDITDDTTMTTTTTDMTTSPAAVAPDVAAPALTGDTAMLGSWMLDRRIWTTNQPSTTVWTDASMTERPAEWEDIAKVGDIVVDTDGNILGYVADIGGFLGIGAKQVLLGEDALHFIRIGDDAFFATNFTREELEALPEFDSSTVMQ